MEKKTFLFVFLALVVLSSLILVYYGLSDRTAYTQEMPILINVDNYIGINTGTDFLNFGTTMPGNDVSRHITIINPFDLKVKVKLSVAGELKDWVILENSFALNSKNSKKIPVSISVPENAEFGNYTGTLRVVMEKVY